MFYSRRSFGFAAVAALAMATTLSLAKPAAADDDHNLTIYAGWRSPADAQLYKLFTTQTGIKVTVVPGKPQELMQRMKLEAENNVADLFVAGDAGMLWHAAQDGLLQPVTSTELSDHVPVGLRDPQNRWFAFSSRARILVYDRKKVKLKLLSTYESLVDPKLQSDILIRSATSLDNQSMLAAMIDAIGPEKAEAWVKGLVQNFARDPRGADADQIRAIVQAVGTIAISNTDSFGHLLSGSTAASFQQFAVFFPNQHDRGASINVIGGGVAVHAPHQANAVKFLDFMLSTEAQRLITDVNFDYPVRSDVPPAAIIATWGAFKADDLRAPAMARNNAAAIDMMNQVGWR